MLDVPWFAQADEAECGESLRAVVERLVQDQKWREDKFMQRLRVYYSGSCGSLEDVRAGRCAQFTGYDEEINPLSRLRHASGAIDTAVSRIGAKQKPKPVLQTSGADYKARQESKRLSKFMLGQFKLPQGRWSNTWEVMLQCLWDAAVFNGVLWVEENLDEERVEAVRVLSVDVYFDEDDAADGIPSQVFRREATDRYELYRRIEEMDEATERKREEAMREDDDEYEYEAPEESFADRKRRLLDAIESAPARSDVRQGGASGPTNSIWVWHAYKRKTCKSDSGCYVAMLADGTVLCRKPFSSRRLPCIILNWVDPVSGVWGDTMTDAQEVPQYAANNAYGNIRDNMRVLSGGHIAVRAGSMLEGEDGETWEQLLSNLNVKVLEYNGEIAPTVVMPPPFNPQVLDMAERWRQFVFEIPGINELASQSRKEPGVNSGVGIRNSNELQDQRFLKQARMFEAAHCTVGHLMLDAVQRLEEAGVKATAWLPSEGLIGDIDWEAIRPDGEDLYTIGIEAGNAFTEGLGQRMQFIDELRASGQIPPDVATRLLLSGDPDLEAYNNRMQGQWTWIERIICEIHEADDKGEVFVEDMPDPMMDLPLAAMQMKMAYLECSAWPDAPANKRKAMRDWYTLCIDMINQTQAPAQAAAPAPGPGEMPPDAGGMPPEGMPPAAPPGMMN